MAYQICYVKTAPCCTMTLGSFCGGTASTCTTVPQCMRSLEVYGCTPDLTQGEFNDCCIQGTFVPVGACCAWTVPAGVCAIIVEVWGAGAGGGSGPYNCLTGGGVGGGGGGYSRKTISVLPNDLITLCAGAGGLMGESGGKSSTTWACTTPQASCSYVRRNGVMCADSLGGAASGPGGNLSIYGSGSYSGITCNQCSDQGNNGTVSAYAPDVQVWASSGFSLCAVGTVACSDFTQGGGAAFGGDAAINVFQTVCNQYLRWNTTCRNSAGVYGPGGNSCSGSTAFNVGLNYGCMTSNCCTWLCERGRAAPPGNFPGGGGAGGTSTCCAGAQGAGGSGASGYIRVYY